MLDSPPPTAVRRRLRQGRDRLATALITAGGIGVIAALLAIGLFLAVEVVPLFWPSGEASAIPAEALWGGGEGGGEAAEDGTRHRWAPTATLAPDEAPRISLAPLAWGTLEAAAWALAIAVPLALGAAAHSSLFMSRRLRSRLKPTLELMEALPGVVVGFVAGLVLAPWVERHLAEVAAALLLLVPGLLLAGGCARGFPHPGVRRCRWAGPGSGWCPGWRWCWPLPCGSRPGSRPWRSTATCAASWRCAWGSTSPCATP